MFFNKKLAKVEQELEETKNVLKQTENELSKLKEFVSFFREKDKAWQLLEEAEKECFTKDDLARLNYLKKTVNQENYRDYITKTQKGRICIDIHQITTTGYLN